MAIEKQPSLAAADVTIVEPKKPRKDRTHWLYIAVIIAVVGGIILGIAAPHVASQLKPLGTYFVDLVKMMISPVIFCTIVLGIGSVRAAASVGKVGGLALIYFLSMSTFALAIGLAVGNIIQPGTGLNASAQWKGETGGHGGAFIPKTIFEPLVNDNVLQTLFVALLIGFALQSLGRQGEPIIQGIAHIQKLVFKVLSMILWLAPIGAFGAIAAVVGETGIGAIKELGVLMLAFYITCVLFIFVVLGGVLYIVTRLNIFKLVRYLGQEYLLIFATSSSESALPSLIAKMEHAGVSKSTVGVVVPTGYSFNLDGTAIYLTMASIFIADALGKPMALPEQLGLLLFMIIASKGAAGVSGAGIAALAAGLQARRPDLLDGVGIIVGIDRFMSEARAVTNFAGNSVATLVIGKWTKSLDMTKITETLNGKNPFVLGDLGEDAPGVVEEVIERVGPVPVMPLGGVSNPAQDMLPTPQTRVTAAQWEEENERMREERLEQEQR